MTKYEWETELRKNIHRLPSDEIKRVMEYYDELFADKAERGFGETEIIAQFGNPVDVADKIISEYDGELEEARAPASDSRKKEKDVQDEEEPPREKEKKREKEEKRKNEKEERKEEKQKPAKAGRRFNGSALVLFIVLNVITVFAFFIVMGALWIALGALAVGGFAAIGGGVLEAIFSFVKIFGGHAAAGFAQAGICVAAVGAGILIVSVMSKLFVFYAKVCGKIFIGIGNWICPKEKVHE